MVIGQFVAPQRIADPGHDRDHPQQAGGPPIGQSPGSAQIEDGVLGVEGRLQFVVPHQQSPDHTGAAYPEGQQGPGRTGEEVRNAGLILEGRGGIGFGRAWWRGTITGIDFSAPREVVLQDTTSTFFALASATHPALLHYRWSSLMGKEDENMADGGMPACPPCPPPAQAEVQASLLTDSAFGWRVL